MSKVRRSGRPNDKSLYVDAFLSNVHVVNVNDNDNEEIRTALNKLNANDLLVLNAYISKHTNTDLKSFLRNIPEKTVAQTRRYKSIVNFYNDLKGKASEYYRTEKASEAEANETVLIGRTEGVNQSF
jgi:hypothetical protein